MQLKKQARRALLTMLVLVTAGLILSDAVARDRDAAAIYGDARPDAPELAARGPLPVGVRTLTVVNPGQLDVLHISKQQPAPLYDRPLTLEIWYPARLAAGQRELTTYTDVLGAGANDPARPNTPFRFRGRALRDAAPAVPVAGAAYPLLIVSHGYPGSRLMMSYLTGNLASQGYVVVAIDHTDSTRADKAAFASTLRNRALDDLFVLNRIAALGAPGNGSFLSGLVDAEHTALIGYSMGGYGALNAAGAGVSAAAVKTVPEAQLAVRQSGNAEFERSRDPRIKAVVAFAPWGQRLHVWDAEGLAGLTVPTLFVVGSQDDVSGYEDGVKRLFEGALHARRYLLTYQNALHNVAPNPGSPAADSTMQDFMAYAEPAWDMHRINNINQHFLTAFLGRYLQGRQALQSYLELQPLAVQGKWSQDAQGKDRPDHTYWKGFKARTAVGLEWHQLAPAAP
jgi:predicted dienelactone hydrolase